MGPSQSWIATTENETVREANSYEVLLSALRKAKKGKASQRFSWMQVMIDEISTLVLKCGICDGIADLHELVSSDELLAIDNTA